jgi:hypothetical protein
MVVLGATARVIWLDAIPRFYFGDEARVGWSLVRTYQSGIPNFFTMGWNDWPWVGISLQGLFGPFFGLTTTSLRMSSALMGTLAIGATYLLARELFTPRMAVLATLLFAMCRTAIDFSRLGICHAQLMCFETFAFFWWWRGVNTGRAASYWWAGVGLGLCVLTYNAGDLVPLLWLGWLGLNVVLAPRSGGAYWRGAVITAAGFLAVAYPWLYYITDHFTFGTTWNEWTIIAHNRQAIGQVLDVWRVSGVGAAAVILWRQIWLTWLGFGVLPGGAYPELGYRGGGMLDDVTATLFVIGMAMSIPWWRRVRESFVLYWWFATAVAGGVATIDAPAIVRLVGLLPAMALLAALPLDKLLRAGAGNRARTAIAAVLVAVLVASAGWVNWQTYFVAFANAPFLDTESALARCIERLPPGSTAFLLGRDSSMTFFYDLFHFNYPDRRLQDVPDPAHFLPLHQPVTFPLALILGPTQVTLARHIRTLYPHTEVTDDIFTPENRLRFRELRLTPEDVAAQTGLQLTVYDSSNAVAAQTTGNPFAGHLDISNTGTRLQWQGRIYWPTDRPLTLTVRADTPTEIRVAGGFVVQANATAPADVVLSLPRGWQPITITEPASGARALSMAIKSPGLTRVVVAWDLNPNPVQEGLTAVYDEDGQPALRAIDPQLNAFADYPMFQPGDEPLVHMPFSAAWTGALRIATPGTYRFDARGIGTYSVRLDDVGLVNAASGPSATNPAERVSYAEWTLTAGIHKLEAHWACPGPVSTVPPAQGQYRLFQMYWAPPDGKRELIPPSSFVPSVPAEAATTLPPSLLTQ